MPTAARFLLCCLVVASWPAVAAAREETAPTLEPAVAAPPPSSLTPAPQPPPIPAAVVQQTVAQPPVPEPVAPPLAPTGDQPPGAGPGRLNFKLNFTPEQGGGSAVGSAVNLDYKREDYAVLTGAVVLHYQDIELHADRAEIDLTAKQVIAQGNVIIDQGPKRLTGNTANFDLTTKTGRVLAATAYLAPDYYFTGVEIDKVGDDTYTIVDGVFTSCEQRVPDWSFRIHRATVTVGGYAHIYGGTMRAKRLPLFYTPWLVWPAMKDRASGFLVPAVHYSSKRGAAINVGYYQTLGDSYDTTIHLEPFFRGSLGIGDEFRYHPTEGTAGDLIGYYIRDEPTHSNRWMVNYNHLTEDLPYGMRAVVHIEDYSDVNYLRDFLHDFNLATLRSFESRAFLTGNWGPSLFNLLLNDNRTYENNGTTYVKAIEQRKLPELSYSLRSTQLWSSPLYLQVQGSADYLDLTRLDLYSGRYGRLDLFPQLTLPVNLVPWLSLSLTGGDRLTYYGGRVVTEPLTGVSSFLHQSLVRNLPLGSAELVGPSISRIYDFEIGNYAKFRHLVEPRITYTYQGSYKNFDEVPLFDEVDSQALNNSVRVALQSRVLGKSGGEGASARELLFLEIARNYSLDKTQPLQASPDGKQSSEGGPLQGTVRVTTTESTNVQAQVMYNTLLSHVGSVSVSANQSFGGGNAIGASWFVSYLPNQIQTTGNGTLIQTFVPVGDQIRINGQATIIKDRLAMQAGFAYDITNHLLQQQDVALNFSSQCYGFRIEYSDFRTLTGPTLNNRNIRFTLTLKGIGPLIDVNSRSTTTGP
jgi:LPS-assembly protein